MSNFFVMTHSVLLRELHNLYMPRGMCYEDIVYLANKYPAKRALERVCKEITEQLEVLNDGHQTNSL